jgi:hypothetical protein
VSPHRRKSLDEESSGARVAPYTGGGFKPSPPQQFDIAIIDSSPQWVYRLFKNDGIASQTCEADLLMPTEDEIVRLLMVLWRR